jgi:hypothetical protein
MAVGWRNRWMEASLPGLLSALEIICCRHTIAPTTKVGTSTRSTRLVRSMYVIPDCVCAPRYNEPCAKFDFATPYDPVLSWQLGTELNNLSQYSNTEHPSFLPNQSFAPWDAVRLVTCQHVHPAFARARARSLSLSLSVCLPPSLSPFLSLSLSHARTHTLFVCLCLLATGRRPQGVISCVRRLP